MNGPFLFKAAYRTTGKPLKGLHSEGLIYNFNVALVKFF